MTPTLADIALPVPLDRQFTYLVPPSLAPLISIGMRVIVPFGRKHLTGIAVAFPEVTSIKGLKPIRDVLDSQPAFSEELLRLTKWIAEYYLTPWGEVLRAATPQGFTHEIKSLVTITSAVTDEILARTKRTAKQQYRILGFLRNGPETVSSLQKKTRASGLRSILREMQEKGWVVVEEKIQGPKAKPKTETYVKLITDHNAVLRGLKRGPTAKQTAVLSVLEKSGEAANLKSLLQAAGATASTIRTLQSKGLVQMLQREVQRGEPEEPEPPREITLNAAQSNALTAATAALDAGRFQAFLLHGVTGSGKTQVYIEAIRHALKQGKTAIVLVPEISLTPQTVRRFRSHFRDDVTVMHSQMSLGERFDAWRAARNGRVKIVIGPRSAVFAPLAKVGLIVIDEEHEASYKQFDATPRYNARDVAIVRASSANAVVILGSATPSVESYFNAQSGKYRLLELPERVDQAHLPRIDIVDMTKERREVLAELRKELKSAGTPFPRQMPVASVSRLLESQITDRVRKKESVILLQNRRGFSHVVECFNCGYVEKCDNCDVTMTFHSIKKHLRCHYCGTVKKPPTVCPSCGSVELRYHAFGTQQVHEELQERFPDAAVLRMDLDTTSRKGAHDKLLRRFGSGEADILLGTQMVAKGLDFPNVTLVGVISADTQMLLPDFRSAERTFQLLTQVAGRAGRSHLAGEVVIQTMQPGHYSLKHVLTHDYQGFYAEEIAYRKELSYPPFSRIVLLEFKGKQEQQVQQRAREYADFLRKESDGRSFEVLGPADAAIPKIKNLFRKHVVIKSFREKDPGGAILRAALQRARHAIEPTKSGVITTIDADPQGMM